MKTILRIFNFIIIGISALATVLLFAVPAFSFYGNVGIKTDTFDKLVPDMEYTRDININDSLGTDVVNIGISFSLSGADLPKVMNGSKENIDNVILSKNIDDIIATLHEPIDLITDTAIKTALKQTIVQQVTSYVDQAREKYATATGSDCTTQDIMDEVGIDDDYFNTFTFELFDASNSDTATVDSVSNVLYTQIDSALTKAEGSGMVDTSEFGESSKTAIKNNLINIYDSLKLIEDGTKVRKISSLIYIYLVDDLKVKLDGKVAATELVQASGETISAYADRLLTLYVLTQIPAPVYQVIGYVSLGLFIGLFAFAAIWLILLIITLIKTFTNKPWTIFGFWFWIVGALQLILGIGITVVGKFVLPNIQNIPFLASLPVKNIVLVPRTYALIPSMLFGGMIVFGIVYAVFRSMAKKVD